MTRAPREKGLFVETTDGFVCKASTYEDEAYPPRGFELRWIERSVPFDGRDVLEVGCGRGRLTFQYAQRAGRVVGTDPNGQQLADARATAERLGLRNVSFVERGAQMGFRGLGRFDIAFFTWSL